MPSPVKQTVILFIFSTLVYLYALPHIGLIHAATKGSFLVHATVQIAVCGNGIVEQGEQCDRVNTAGNTCDSLGHGKGVLQCDNSCTFDFSSCEDTSNPIFTAVVPYYEEITRCEPSSDIPVFKEKIPARSTISAVIRTDKDGAASVNLQTDFFVAYNLQIGEASLHNEIFAGAVNLTGYG